MNNYIFIFDLDGTLTTKETLPFMANSLKEKKILKLTKKSIRGEIPYIENFIKRVNILKKYPIKKIDTITSKIKLNTILKFINSNPESCAIATTNIDVWIKKLTKQIKAPIYTSKAEIENGYIKKLTYILKKEDIVKKYQKLGKKVVFIGDGHNDLEAMRIADISIAVGFIHYPANSLLSIVDYLVFSEIKLLNFIKQIRNPNKKDISIILSAAGIGSRLGLSKTKVLLKINKNSLLKWHLNNFKNIEDLRIVIGYQSNEVIKETLKYRKDILFVYNHDYFYTKTGYSYYLGAKYANRYVIEWDGDLIVNPKYVNKLLIQKEYVAGSKILSENPVFLEVVKNKVINFSDTNGNFEWSGPCCLKKEKIIKHKGNVFEILKPYLPIEFKKIEAMDIDTYEDYKNAKKLLKDFDE